MGKPDSKWHLTKLRMPSKLIKEFKGLSNCSNSVNSTSSSLSGGGGGDGKKMMTTTDSYNQNHHITSTGEYQNHNHPNLVFQPIGECISKYYANEPISHPEQQQQQRQRHRQQQQQQQQTNVNEGKKHRRQIEYRVHL